MDRGADGSAFLGATRVAALLAVAAVALAAAAPARASHFIRMQLHAKVEFTGQTGSVPGSGTAVRATGRVLVSARLDHGPWYLVMRTVTDAAGRYRATFKPSRRGVYRVRLGTPD